MHHDLTQREILTELEPITERCLDNHLHTSKPSRPHDYIP
ncbi:hypothetical protein DFR75_108138 [Nocardia ignorata]|uniref:Uncharacterized protein n=1 Tax=Nocardia ignorata TaxID=145285 RepID=A0A4R6P3C1_NOCIG|nr:hypothetical protein DFR75_108138 [Nocardia ignorata]